MKIKVLLPLLLMLLINILSQAQVVWTEPPFPTQLDDITLFFDATKGNAGLENFSGDVYAHTGLITNQSSSPTDWKLVQGVWGTDDPKTKMTSEGNNIYSLSYNITDFYEIPGGVTVEQMAFVFRNVDGSTAGRAEDGSDIYTPVYPPSEDLLISINSPIDNSFIFEGDNYSLNFNLNKEAEVTVSDNGSIIYTGTTDKINEVVTPSGLGQHIIDISITDDDDQHLYEIRYLLLSPTANVANAPPGTEDGLNYTEDGYIFQLLAPSKGAVFFLCPANEFNVDLAYRMNKTIDAARYWIELPKENFEGDKNLYQYLVDGNIKIADPYSEVILDPNNDQWVEEETMALYPEYPSETTNGIVTVFDLDQLPYNWQTPEFEKPKKEDLVIYELLMRDFLGDHSYTSLLDTLDYLDRLGINAIELMPINEFEGNISWGYNPSFHMALDKYYGSKDQLKQVIDEAHKRGIAIILDVVFNHHFSQSPLAQLYWDATNFRPAANNPWLNVVAKHPFNVGYDMNHESPLTKLWTKRILSYWMEEFKVDGFRFDLSKGLTQKDSGNNSSLMSAYDQSRINIITDYADHIWDIDEDTYVILEHFADNAEEKVFSAAGMMLWGNMTHQYQEATMGYTSDLEGTDYTQRGWTEAGLLPYMESHDEERLRYKIKEYGNSSGDYDTKDFKNSMKRLAAGACIYFSIPGPKMIWQFGELGYDFSINRCEDGSINENCRLSPKPIRWDYYNDDVRRNLYNRYAALIHLKKTYPAFSTTDFDVNDQVYGKNVVLRNNGDDAVIIANMKVTSETMSPNFTKTGTWYEYFSGNIINVNSTNQVITLPPGEFRVFTTEPISPPNGHITTTKEEYIEEITITPNLVNEDFTNLEIAIDYNQDIDDVYFISSTGVKTKANYTIGEKLIVPIPDGLGQGLYTVLINSSNAIYRGKVVVVK